MAQITQLLKDFLRLFNQEEGDVVYDLGCGYGRAVFTGALTHPSTTFKGIEFVADRVKDANEVRERLGLANAQFICRNVRDRDMDFSDGNIFYMFNPFSTSTLMEVMAKLSVIGREKRILVATYWMGGGIFEYIPWLREITNIGENNFDLTVYESSYPQSFFPERVKEVPRVIKMDFFK